LLALCSAAVAHAVQARKRGGAEAPTGVGHVCRAEDAPDLLHRVEVGREPAMDAEDLLGSCASGGA
jgi:hypothetical protein